MKNISPPTAAATQELLEIVSDRNVPLSGMRITALLDAGADIEVRDKNGHTPLICATVRHAEWLVKILLARGAAADARGKFGETALMLSEDPPITRALLEAGADARLSAEGYCGMSVVHFAVGRQRVEYDDMLAQLIHHGADVNAQDQLGDTPLMLAVTLMKYQTIRRLLRAGASLDIENRVQQSPRKIAAPEITAFFAKVNDEMRLRSIAGARHLALTAPVKLPPVLHPRRQRGAP